MLSLHCTVDESLILSPCSVTAGGLNVSLSPHLSFHYSRPADSVSES